MSIIFISTPKDFKVKNNINCSMLNGAVGNRKLFIVLLNILPISLLQRNPPIWTQRFLAFLTWISYELGRCL